MRAFLLFCLLLPQLAFADLILFLSDNKPSITGVAQAIQLQYGGKIETYHLYGDKGRIPDAANSIKNSPTRQVVAVGLLAAQASRQYLQSKQVVFCQVLNYEEFDLVTPGMKGVSAIPSLNRQFKAWKLLDPNLRKIGVITSKNMANAAREAQAAAKANNLEIVYGEAESDREVIPVLRKMAANIQGLWLAPDSHILSNNIIMEVMSYSVKQNIQTLVFSPALLKEGGLLSGTQDFSEIARLVLTKMKQPEGEAVTPLSAAHVRINSKAAERFGLTVNEKLKEMADVE